jgi:putative hydrolase of the HAD superfamily
MAARSFDTWVFDLDNTLYPARCNLFAQVDERIGQFMASYLNVDRVEARRLQKEYWRAHGTSLRGLMLLHDCPPEEFLHYVHDIDVSGVEPSLALDTALAQLPGRKVIFTNGTVPHAKRIMDRLGVSHHFDGIFDIVASAYIPKPERSVYQQMIQQHGIDPRRAIMLDDMAHNLKPAHDMGMATVWVRTPESLVRHEQSGADKSHLHHETDDLVEWLQTWLAQR